MADDAGLRKCLVCLAILMVIVGFYTHSWKKTIVTYIFGMFGIVGIVLPDWEFFDRPVSEWTSPLSVAHMPPANTPPTTSRFKFYPVRTIIYVTVYGFAFYKWWMYIST